MIEKGNVDLDFNDYAVGSHHDYNSLTYTGQTTTLLSFDAQRDLPSIGGFSLNADAELAFASENGVRKSVATLHVTLPPTFDAFGDGDQPSTAVAVSASNNSGFSLDSLDIDVPNASIGGIGLQDLTFHYAAGGDQDPDVMCTSDYWHATGNIFLGEGVGGAPGAGILMTPPPVQNGISFCEGDFKGAGALLQFGCPLLCPPELFPGVFLDDIHFAVGLNPTVLTGGATLSAAEITKISGTLFAVFASPSEPYTLTTADAGTDPSRIWPGAGSRARRLRSAVPYRCTCQGWAT